MYFLTRKMKVYKNKSLLTSLDKEAYFHMNQKFHEQELEEGEENSRTPN